MPLPADDPRATADEIVKRPLPFPECDAHISVKPVTTPATIRRQLEEYQRGLRKPNEDAVAVLSGRNGRLRDFNR
jgi:hypothetical protein